MTTAPARRLYGPNGQAINGSTAAGQPLRAEATTPTPLRFAQFPIRTLPTQTPAVETGPPQEQHAHAQPVPDPRAEAEAEAIRQRAEAEAEARRIEAEARADAERIKAAEEAEAQRLANEKEALNLKRNQMRFEREQADHGAKLAAANRKREEEERAARKAREQADEEQRTAAEAKDRVEQSAKSWRRWAIGFAIVCGIVALPVQMDAFWNPGEPWLVAAPAVLEGLAWVIHRGARAAVDEHRPHWHYRLIIWGAAFVAAAINLVHGLDRFDAATAIGTAFASLAGPGVWDLHEHGRIRTRDGKLTRAERRAQEREEKRIAAEKQAAEDRRATEKAEAEKAAAEAAAKLAKEREELYPNEWKRALAVAAAVGETTVTEAVWRRAWRDLHAADPAETVEVVNVRNTAATRMTRAVTQGAEKRTEKHVSSQVGSQMPTPRRTGPKTGPVVRGIRRAGDTPRYVNAARKQAAITAKNAATNTPKEGN